MGSILESEVSSERECWKIEEVGIRARLLTVPELVRARLTLGTTSKMLEQVQDLVEKLRELFEAVHLRPTSASACNSQSAFTSSHRRLTAENCSRSYLF